MIDGEATMPTISGSSASRALAAVPFAYLIATRVRTPRDWAYLVATSWVPAIWLLFRLADLGPLEALGSFALGYLAFVALYEIGYFVNDAWDAKRGEAGRKRLGFSPGTAYAILFVSIRVATWAAVGWITGWLSNPAWLAGHAALFLAFAQHNLVAGNGLRLASFYQLAVLRFVMPILGALAPPAYPAALIAAILLYAYLRYLSYADSKDLLNLPERKTPRFGLLQLVMLAPLVGFIAVILDAAPIAELLVYMIAVHAAWWLFARVRGESFSR